MHLQFSGHPVQQSWGQSRSAVARGLFLFIPALLKQPFTVWFLGIAGHSQLDKQFACSPLLVQRSGPETTYAFELLFPSWLRACLLAGRRCVTRDICCFICSQPCEAQLCWTASWEEPMAADMTPPGPLCTFAFRADQVPEKLSRNRHLLNMTSASR